MNKKLLIFLVVVVVLIIIGVLASGSSDVKESFDSGFEQGRQAVEGNSQ